jgi:hypothetical protein
MRGAKLQIIAADSICGGVSFNYTNKSFINLGNMNICYRRTPYYCKVQYKKKSHTLVEALGCIL